ncbi:hypothetical protein K2173_018423 [Erythroxylum novogranatense]|uniref:IBH1-like N-terminal domain-containing protein n=1 Tax=Erythroxylum novogranatense TaxID=1862640 RepID=A0AAV8UAE7_9ROSI|nr:hypothetical protein K2173_018423 [Erythroxylum novogranatense]
MTPHQISLNPSSMKARFTIVFLRALKKIRTGTPPLSSPREVFQRYRRVRTAADKSLVFAVGSRRAWSRAMLCKIRNQARRRQSFPKRIRTRPIKKNEIKKTLTDEEGGVGLANDLRKLVPGAETMDLCRLLDETAHYIRCLNTQVQVLRSVADLYSA